MEIISLIIPYLTNCLLCLASLIKLLMNMENVDMNEYWKDPRLDDEGTYDYLVEELPSDTVGWQWYYQKCESCGKYHRLNFDSTHYFYCWDGWDSMSYTECWKCKLKSKIYGVRAKIKREFRQQKEYHKWIKRFKEKNIPITKELKETTKKICREGR